MTYPSPNLFPSSSLFLSSEAAASSSPPAAQSGPYFTGDQAGALTRLRSMVAATADPEALLGDDDLAVLLEDARRTDSAGIPVGDAAWQPTWNLDAAAAAGWRLKAAIAAGDFDVNLDGLQFLRSQKVASYEARAEAAARRAALNSAMLGV